MLTEEHLCLTGIALRSLRILRETLFPLRVFRVKPLLVDSPSTRLSREGNEGCEGKGIYAEDAEDKKIGSRIWVLGSVVQ